MWWPPTTANPYNYPNPVPQWQITPQPVGCICPAGANKECENPICPRKPYTRSAVGKHL